MIRQRVEAAWQIQKERFRGTEIRFNSRMGHRELEMFCALGSREERLMRRIYESEEMSGRGRDRLLKVARTIADLEGGGPIQERHLMEAADIGAGFADTGEVGTVTEREREYLYLLCRIKGLGAVTIRRLREIYDSFESIYYIEETGREEEFPALHRVYARIREGQGQQGEDSGRIS